MSTEMLDRLQEDKLAALERLADSYNLAVAAGGGDDEAAAIADFVVDEAIGMRQSSLRLWEFHWARALAGSLPNRSEHGNRLMALLERSGTMIRRGTEIARAYADRSGCQVARLALLEQQSLAFPVWAKECRARWRMLDKPSRPLNHQRIAESQAAYQRGEGELLSDVVARLERGEA